MKSSRRSAIVLLLILVASGAATAGPCDVYYKFDGNLADSSGNGHDGQMIGAKGVPARPVFVEGKNGKALKLDGSSTMRAFVDLSYERCPKMTFATWINVEPAPSQMVLGVSHALFVMAAERTLRLRGRGKDINAHDALMPSAGWMFIAATWDAETGKTTLHWRNRSLQGQLGTSTRVSPPAIFLGALNDALHFGAKQMVLDDFRLFGKVLTHDELMALQAGGRGGASEPQAAEPGTTTTRDPANASCAAPGDCSSGFYCAVDNVCYPDSQRPMASASSTDPRPISVTGPIAPPQPDLELPTQSADSATGIAGRWQSSQAGDSGILGGGGHLVTIEFHGPDSGLTGNMRVIASSPFGTIDNTSPLSNITRSGNTVSFSAADGNTVVGQISTDVTTITIGQGGGLDNLVLQRTASGSEFLPDPNASYVMAGDWSMLQTSGGSNVLAGSSVMLTFSFSGPDNALSGRMMVAGQVFGGPVEQEEPLSDIVKNAQSISFSTQSSGSFVGQLSGDNTQMTLQASGSSGAETMVFEKQ